MNTAVKEVKKQVKYDYNANEYDKVLEPDDDFYRAISAEEFKKRCLKVIDKIFDK